jgi:hypothetical protein
MERRKVLEKVGEEEEGKLGGEDWLLGGGRKAKVSMGARHAPLPLAGPSFPLCGSTRRSRSRTSIVLHRRLFRRRSYEAFFGASEPHVALAILRRHAGRRTGRVSGSWQLHDPTASHSIQHSSIVRAYLRVFENTRPHVMASSLCFFFNCDMYQFKIRTHQKTVVVCGMSSIIRCTCVRAFVSKRKS